MKPGGTVVVTFGSGLEITKARTREVSTNKQPVLCPKAGLVQQLSQHETNLREATSNKSMRSWSRRILQVHAEYVRSFQVRRTEGL